MSAVQKLKVYLSRYSTISLRWFDAGFASATSPFSLFLSSWNTDGKLLHRESDIGSILLRELSSASTSRSAITSWRPQYFMQILAHRCHIYCDYNSRFKCRPCDFKVLQLISRNFINTIVILRGERDGKRVENSWNFSEQSRQRNLLLRILLLASKKKLHIIRDRKCIPAILVLWISRCSTKRIVFAFTRGAGHIHQTRGAIYSLTAARLIVSPTH